MTRTLLLLVAVGAMGCLEKVGNGQLERQGRLLPPFTRVAVGNGLHLDTSRGDQALTFTADSNLLPYLVASVEDGTLEIGIAGAFNLAQRTPIGVALTTEGLVGVIASGGAVAMVETPGPVSSFSAVASGMSAVTLRNVSVPELMLVASVGGRIAAHGAATRLTASGLSGSGIDASDLRAEDASVLVSGSSTFLLNATRSITASVSGASHLFVSGRTPARTVTSSENAFVTWLDD